MRWRHRSWGSDQRDATSSGYGLIAVPSHQRRSGPSSNTAKCRCGASALAVAGGADVADHLPAPQHLVFGDARRIPLQMGVVVGVGALRVELVQGDAAALAREQFFDAAVGHRQHGRARRRHDVDGIVHAAAAARIGEGVAQLLRADAADRNQQASRWRGPGVGGRRRRCGGDHRRRPRWRGGLVEGRGRRLGRDDRIVCMPNLRLRGLAPAGNAHGEQRERHIQQRAQAPAGSARDTHGLQSRKLTGVPAATAPATASAAKLVSRTQPLDWSRLMSPGSEVPWMP